MAVDYLEAIERISRLECGYATVKDVKDHRLENRMESFFLAETLKYLYLIFDEDSFLHNDLSNNDYKIIKNNLGECLIETGYFFFNTEAHPVDGASLECCRSLNGAKQNTSLIDKLNLDKLIEKHILFDTNEKPTLNKEYLEDKTKKEMENLNENNWRSKLCDKITNDSVYKEFIVDSMTEYHRVGNPLMCSLNDTFKLRMSYVNSENYFP